MTRPSDRALGALYGLAIGDALGMPTQSLPREAILERYGPLLSGFETPAPDHPLASGLQAGSVTDDTEQAIVLAELLIEGKGSIDPQRLAARLLAWEHDMRERGSLDLLGPSTKLALDELLAGAEPDRAGRRGGTNGAAMRITPLGIATPTADLPALVDQVVAASRVTHNTGLALSGAAAVAAAVSAGIDGATVAEATEVAIEAARLGARRGHWIAGADVAARIEWTTQLDLSGGQERVAGLIYTLVGTSLATQESVPAAFAVLGSVPDDPWTACRLAASLGGDCDTIAAMVGAIAGACHGVEAYGEQWRETVNAVNGLHLEPLAEALLALRHSAGAR